MTDVYIFTNITSKMAKQYGLILPKNSKDHPVLPVSKSHSIFNEDSDSDTPDISKPTGSQTVKRQDKINQKKAVEEDPTVYQYDEIYDDMEQQRQESKLAKKNQDRKPKYINRLLAAAEKRKRENERRIERQVQKEREEEGDMYKDKESFVTSAYKKKLEEMKKLEEEEKREEYLESIGDVRKQGNLDGFYRHLYDQKVNYDEKTETKIKEEVKSEPKSDSDNDIEIADSHNDEKISTTPPQNSTQPKEESSDDETRSRKRKSPEIHKLSKKKIRNYRSRKDSDEDNNETEEPEIKKEHLPSNLDADSDFSIDSTDSEEEHPSSDKIKEAQEQPAQQVKEEKDPADKVIDGKEKDLPKEEIKTEDPPKTKKTKIDVWKKRTVGEKFDEAVKRYFERKAQKEMGL